MKKPLTYCLIISGALLLGGCASHKPVWRTAVNSSTETPKQVEQNSDEAIKASLADAAASAAVSLRNLAAINVYEQSKKATLPFVTITDPALNVLMPDVNYYGPARKLLQTVAKNTGYQLQIFGKTPATPLLVQVDDTQNAITAKEIITDIALQVGNNANVMILPNEKIISLRYVVR